MDVIHSGEVVSSTSLDMWQTVWHPIWQGDIQYDSTTHFMMAWHAVWWHDVTLYDKVTHHTTIWHTVWRCDTSYDNMTHCMTHCMTIWLHDNVHMWRAVWPFDYMLGQPLLCSETEGSVLMALFVCTRLAAHLSGWSLYCLSGLVKPIII